VPRWIDFHACDAAPPLPDLAIPVLRSSDIAPKRAGLHCGYQQCNRRANAADERIRQPTQAVNRVQVGAERNIALQL
jgi:hypothetical protein